MALKTRRIAVPVAPARREHPLARACGSWPPSRLARKNHQPYLPPPVPCGQGMISATGFFAMAWPTSRAASGPAPSSLARAP